MNSSTFHNDLTSAVRAGLTRGAGQPIGRLDTLAEAEIRYRQQRAIVDAERARLRKQARAAQRVRRSEAGHGNAGGNREELVSRWTTWFQFALAGHSSAVAQSSSVCDC